jgi:uncharacterized protein
MNFLSKMSRVNRFLLMTFVINWSIAGLFIILFPDKPKIPFMIMGVLYMLIPASMALVSDKLIDKKKSIKSLAINFRPNWWYLAAWPGVIIVTFLMLGVGVLWPSISFSPDMSGFVERMSAQMDAVQVGMLKAQIDSSRSTLFIQIIAEAFAAEISINAVAAFGEELGWRGFLVREYKELNFWSAALRIGFIWGLWHAPLILMGHNYPQHPVLGVGMMIIWCMLLSPLILFVRLKTHSVIGAAIMHGTINASAGIPLLFIAGGNDLVAGATGFTGMIALAIVIAVTVLYDLKFSKNPVTNKTIMEAIRQDVNKPVIPTSIKP